MVRKIIDGQLVSPPLTGKLLDGRYVTGYNKLPLEILKAEGWKAYSIINYTEELDESQIVKNRANGNRN